MVPHSFSFLQIHLFVKFPGTFGYSKLVALGSRVLVLRDINPFNSIYLFMSITV